MTKALLRPSIIAQTLLLSVTPKRCPQRCHQRFPQVLHLGCCFSLIPLSVAPNVAASGLSCVVST